MSRVTALRMGVVVINAFVAISAIPGAIWVVPTLPMEWMKAGPFTDWTIPALALGFVGVVATGTAILALVRPWGGALASIAAGACLVVFEVVEVGVVGWTLADPSLPGFEKWLQLIYLIAGGVQMALGAGLWAVTRRSAPKLPLINRVATAA